MPEKQDDEQITINHKTELLLWLIILFIIVAIVSSSFMYKSKNDENDYQVFLPDVDGLTVGASVRMMGVEVGHVVKIKPVKDEVYVKFILTDPDVYIPQGTSVTVEFSGMAGSKSLELYLPDKDTYIDVSTPIMTVNPPKRLHDALKLLDDMYKKLSSIIYTCSSFGEKMSEANLKPEHISSEKDMEGLIKYSNDFLENSTQKVDEVRKNIEGFRKNGKEIQ